MNENEVETPHKYIEQINYWKRDEYGLLPSVDYIFKEDEPNKIDWYKMIPTKFIVPNKDKFPEGTNFASLKMEEVDDNKKLILLAGFKYILSIRGYSKVTQEVVSASSQYAATVCSIEFTPNFETNMQPVTFTGEADAHLSNTYNFARDYLVAIASNRSFVRSLRNALSINVLGSDELGPQKKGDEAKEENANNCNPAGPQAAVERALNKKGRTFESLKNRLIKDKEFLESAAQSAEQVMAWKNENDISNNIAIKILGWISKN